MADYGKDVHALSLIVLFCVVKYSECASCPAIPDQARIACGGAEISQVECESQGCCWASTEAQAPQCYKRECKDGYFGWNCRFQCQCDEGKPCDKVTGQCPSGCNRNWWGDNCQLVSNCRYNDPAGFHYMGKQNFAIDNTMCRRWHHHTYAANRFKDGSLEDVHNYCRNPKNSDGEPDSGGLWCYTTRYGGWKRCSIPQCDCPDHLFGINCEKQCHCHSKTEVCDKKTGRCASGCADGWSGPACQACSAGRFGPGCRHECHCKDRGEVCDAVEGHCVSGCAEGYAGQSCHLAIPRLTRKAVLLNRSGNTVTIKWNKWSRPPDLGDGPVKRYTVYYKKASDFEWQKDVPGDKTMTTVLGLSNSTRYLFKVAPVHGDGFQGFYSPTLAISTCGKPTSGPRELQTRTSLEDRNELRHFLNTDSRQLQHAQLTVTWQKPMKLHYNCEQITAYRVYYKLHTDEVFVFKEQVSTTTVILRHLQVYTNYTIGISAVNNAGIESDKVILLAATAIGKPGPVRQLQISTSATAFSLLWEKPRETNGPIWQYALHHKQLTTSGCGIEVPVWSSIVKLSKGLTTYRITGLQPHSKYEIQLWAETEAGRGQMVTAHTTTLPQVPSAAPMKVNISKVDKTYLTFTWEELPCKERNGDFLGYEYELLSDSRLVVSRTIGTTRVTLTNLTPYVMYGFHVRYVNSKGKGPFSETKQTVTLQDKPPAPGHVRVISSGVDSAIVSWSRPNPPCGKLILYHVWHSTEEGFNDITKVLPHLQQVKLTQLTANTTYFIQVRAQTEAGIGNWSRKTAFFVEEDYPSKPQHLQNVSRTSTGLTFRWEEPLEKNGVLQKYKLSCGFVDTLLGQFLSGSRENNLSSSLREFTMTGLQPGMQYRCCVSASTSKGFGEQECKLVWTAPVAPDMPSQLMVDHLQATDSTIAIQLPPPLADSVYQRSFYQLIVEKLVSESEEKRVKRSPNPCGGDNAVYYSYEVALQKSLNCYLTAQLSKGELDKVFIVGDNLTYQGYHNVPLQQGALYDIWLRRIVVVDGETAVSYARLPNPVVAQKYVSSGPQQDNTVVYAGTAVGVIIAVMFLAAVIVILMFRRRRKDELGLVDMPVNLASVKRPAVPGSSSTESLTPDFTETEPLYGSMEKVGDNRKAISVDHLWNYIKEKKSSKIDGFRQEYDEIPMGLKAKCEVAKRPENKHKNRYGNIIAYDHSRVILDIVDDDPYSDYINADYIEAYKGPRRYIATQGPSKYTVNDIWRMAWQENSNSIVMVTNLVEDGRHKCEQYWPDMASKMYDDIRVELINVERLADYTIRTFILTKALESKTVKQFHFTAWPDHGVPTYATSLLAFRKKVRANDDPSAGPTIVHCSAGVGRTGTYIALDFLLDQARSEGQVDVYNCVRLMRTKRVNMIQTLEQYIFVHDALLESLKCGDTSVPFSEFRDKYYDLCQTNIDTGKTRLQEEFELLKITSTCHMEPCRDALDVENINKNRFRDIVPYDDLSRPYLVTYIPGCTDYINAIYVDGYKQRDAFIVTQMPLPNTVLDFWTMLFDHKCNTVVMLNEVDKNDETCGIYWKNNVGSHECGPFTIDLVNVDTSNLDVTIRDFKVSYTSRFQQTMPRSIRQLQYHGWTQDFTLPMYKSSLMDLIKHVESWQQTSGSGPTILHCLDGGSQSGLYCAVSYMLEKMRVEREVDVFQTVKHVRMNRPQLISCLEQYQFCYELALEYMDALETDKEQIRL